MTTILRFEALDKGVARLMVGTILNFLHDDSYEWNHFTRTYCLIILLLNSENSEKNLLLLTSTTKIVS